MGKVRPTTQLVKSEFASPGIHRSRSPADWLLMQFLRMILSCVFGHYLPFDVDGDFQFVLEMDGAAIITLHGRSRPADGGAIMRPMIHDG